MNVTANVHLRANTVLRVYNTCGYTNPNIGFKGANYGPEFTVFFENDDQLAELGRQIDAYLAGKKSCREIDAAVSAMPTEELERSLTGYRGPKQAMAPASYDHVFEAVR